MTIRLVLEFEDKYESAEDVAYSIEDVLEKCMRILENRLSLIKINGKEVLTRLEDEYVIRAGLNDICVVSENYDQESIDIYIE